MLAVLWEVGSTEMKHVDEEKKELRGQTLNTQMEGGSTTHNIP